MEPYVDQKKPLADWAHWRGPIDVNRFIREGLAVAVGDKLWCHSIGDKTKLLELMEADAARPKQAP